MRKALGAALLLTPFGLITAGAIIAHGVLFALVCWAIVAAMYLMIWGGIALLDAAD